jgi:DNA-binding GntR family transcriptional regulator
MDLAGKFVGDKNSLIPFKKLSKVIAEVIKEDIISGRYKSGERLKEAELATKYSVSKTPIREAIQYLVGIGFIEMIPHTMIRVTKMDKKEVQNLYCIQSVLEGLAAREALLNLTEENYEEMEMRIAHMEKYAQVSDYSEYSKENNRFHSIFWQASNNERLLEMLQNTHERIQRFHSVPRRFPDRFKAFAVEHRKILEVTAQKNADNLEMLFRKHIQNHERQIVDLLEKEDIF